jgi:hypothetical protein
MNMMRPPFVFPVILACLSTGFAVEGFAEAPRIVETVFVQRRDAVIEDIRKNTTPQQINNPDFAVVLALLDLFQNRNVEEANRSVLAYCGADKMTTYVGKPVPKNRSDAILRIGLLESTRGRLTKEAREAIEDFAWELLTKFPLGMSRATADKAETAHLLLPNNGMTNLWRRYALALRIVLLSERYGPKKILDGDTVANHWQAWERFWIRFFKTFPKEGTDMDIAHPSSYGQCTVGAMYDMVDLSGNAEIKRLAGNFLTLFWAEVAAEFDPGIGWRMGLATTRDPNNYARGFWPQALLYCYQWHNNTPFANLGDALFLTSGYRPPEILAAIARNTDRGGYLTTGRRPGLISTPDIAETKTVYVGDRPHPRIIFDRNGHSHFRRDVYYTPDYALGTFTTDPACDYINELVLTPNVGASFPTPGKDRIQVSGKGYYPVRPTNGMTGPGVSIIARDPKAQFGVGRFKSNGTRVFLSNGPLWDNRVEDASGWFFTRCGNAYAAIRPAGGGYVIPDPGVTYSFNGAAADRKVIEVEDKRGHYLELNDMWAPVVLQMGRARDYDSFEAFQKSVKENPFTYEEGKLTYTSEAGDTYEAWAKFPQLPKINGTTINLNPEYTFNNPYLKMKHGSNKAVISYPGYEDLVLDFSKSERP